MKNSDQHNHSHLEKPQHQRLIKSDSRQKKFRICGEKSPSPCGKIAGVLGEEDVMIPKYGFGVERGGDMGLKGLGQGVFRCEGRKRRKGKGKGGESQVSKINMNDYLLKSYGFN
jgi:hypothetical protein